jgi:uncharacterized caspase-like protein
MIVKWAALLLSVLVVFGLSGEAFAQKRVALLIGNSAYRYAGQLKNPVNDVALMEQTLRGAGFDDVEVALDLGQRDLRIALRRFEEKSSQSDVGVLYYSGHGIEVNGQNYVLPIDAKLASDGDIEDEAVPLDRVMKSVEGVKRLKLVILDACRDNPFIASMRRSSGTRSVGVGLAKVEPSTTGTLIAYAAKAGTTAADGGGQNSPFTSALAKYVAQPGLDIRLALGKVRDDVLQATQNRQEPFVYGSLGGDLLSLVPPPQAATAPVPSSSADRCSAAALHWTEISKLNRLNFYQEHLALFPDCAFAGLARIKIDELSRSAALPAPAADPAVDGAARAQRPPGDLPFKIQLELQRVGCLSGRPTREWDPRAKAAARSFIQYTAATLDTDVASDEMLKALNLSKSRVCPPTCGPGRALNQRGVCAPLASAAVQASPKLKPVQKPVPAQPSSDASASPAGKMYNALQPGMNCQQFGVPQTPQTLSYFCR